MGALCIGHYAYGINEPGGVRTYVLSLAAAQRELGCTVHLLDHADRRLAPGAPTDWDVRWVDGAADLARTCAALGCDVLHLHSGLPHGLLSGWQGVPVVRTLHGHSPYCPSQSRFLERRGVPCPRAYDPLGCLAAHFVDHCGSIRPQNLVFAYSHHRAERDAVAGMPTLVVSEFCRRELVRGGHPGTDLHVLQLPAWKGVGEYTAPPGAGAPHVLFLGRLVPAKGLAWLLRALARVRVPLHLDVAGEGYRGAELRRLAGELGLGERVTFHGWVAPDGAAKLLRRALALVVPSVWHEPSGTVTVEAAAAGRAVIAARAGGLPEYVVDGGTGLIVEPGDVEGLAAALARLAMDRALAAEMGWRGRERVPKAFDMGVHLARIGAVYTGARAERAAAG